MFCVTRLVSPLGLDLCPDVRHTDPCVTPVLLHVVTLHIACHSGSCSASPCIAFAVLYITVCCVSECVLFVQRRAIVQRCDRGESIWGASPLPAENTAWVPTLRACCVCVAVYYTTLEGILRCCVWCCCRPKCWLCQWVTPDLCDTWCSEKAVFGNTVAVCFVSFCVCALLCICCLCGHACWSISCASHGGRGSGVAYQSEKMLHLGIRVHVPCAPPHPLGYHSRSCPL